MNDKFKQKRIDFSEKNSTNKLKVEKLCELISEHKYKDEIYESFNIRAIKSEYISIDNIDIMFDVISTINSAYKRFNLMAQTKNINVFEKEKVIDGKVEKRICFKFDEYVEIDEVKDDLEAISIYNAKNTFLDEYNMTKYANSLFDKGLAHLANCNVEYFRELAKVDDKYNKYRSYRFVEHKNEIYLRGITSEKYNEYGVDFAFVVSMLIFHNSMKNNVGVNYKIKDCHLNESKLEMTVMEKKLIDASSFGTISTAVKVSTNDLGQGSLNFTNVVNVSKDINNGFFLYPKNSKLNTNKIAITHTTKPKKVLAIVKEIDNQLSSGEDVLKDLNDIKTIKSPDEIRVKILSKIQHPRSAFKEIKELSDIFKRKIDNEINNLNKLFEMCNKAEELDIKFELKDKLRYIISDIMLYGKVT